MKLPLTSSIFARVFPRVFTGTRSHAICCWRSSLDSTLHSCTTSAWIWPSWLASCWTWVYSILTQRREYIQQCWELCVLLTTRYTLISKDKLFTWTHFRIVGAKICFSRLSDMATLLHRNHTTFHCTYCQKK